MNQSNSMTRHGQVDNDRQGSAPGNLVRNLCLGAALTVGLPGLAAAQSATASPAGWQFEITPYLWMSGMKGDVQSGNLPKTSLDAGFSDVLDVLDFALMGALEARNGRWGLLFDAQYMKLSDSATAKRTGAGPIGASLTASAEVEMEQTMLAAAAAYRLSTGPTLVDAIGGLRYMRIEVDADIGASLFGPGGGGARAVSRSGSESWIDPYIGVRVQHPIADRWTIEGYVDVGGFNVGSKSAVQASAGVIYDFSKTVSGKLGYRYLSVDYDDDGFLFDMEIQGAYLGVGFRF